MSIKAKPQAAAGEPPPEEHVHDQPVLTGPYCEPTRHWKVLDGETVDEIVHGRRQADEPLPIGSGGPEQQGFDFNSGSGYAGSIDKLRSEIREWRDQGWPGTTNATRELLEYWSREPGEGPVYSLFYAQREAVETVVYLTECTTASHWMVKRLKEIAEDWNCELLRIGLRMATGTGKTAVMACLISWYAVNRKREHRARAQGLSRNVDRVVVVCPGRTIRDRLAGLNPRVKCNLYDDWRLVPTKLRRRLAGLPVHIINWEKLQPRKGTAYNEIAANGTKPNLSPGRRDHARCGQRKSRSPGINRTNLVTSARPRQQRTQRTGRCIQR